jgi:hypothetical protein
LQPPSRAICSAGIWKRFTTSDTHKLLLFVMAGCPGVLILSAVAWFGHHPAWLVSSPERCRNRS